MEMSLAKKHFEHTSAQQAAKQPDTPVATGRATPYERMLLILADHKRQLKAIQSIENKIALKRTLLPEYDAWVAGVLAANTGKQDDVIMTVMVWRFDIGDLAHGLAIAEYALAHHLAMPDTYARTTGTLVAEEVADYALDALNEDPPNATDLVGYLRDTEQLVHDEDMPDEVRAKLHKALGYALKDSDPNKALVELKRALELHSRVGVKKDIERLESQLKKAAKEAKDKANPIDEPSASVETPNKNISEETAINKVVLDMTMPPWKYFGIEDDKSSHSDTPTELPATSVEPIESVVIPPPES